MERSARMPTCNGCGREMSPDWRLCPYCGYPAYPWVPPAVPQQFAPHTPGVKKPDTAMLVGAVIIALAVTIPYSVGMIMLAQSLRGIEIDSWYYWTNTVGDFVFSVNVTNYGTETRTATITCVVAFDSDGATFSKDRRVILDPGETRTQKIYVYLDNQHHHLPDYSVRCYLK